MSIPATYNLSVIHINIQMQFGNNTDLTNSIEILKREISNDYSKLKSCIAAEISEDRINEIYVDLTEKIERIYNLCLIKNMSQLSNKVQIGNNIVESIISLLSESKGHISTQKKLIKLGFDTLKYSYALNFEELVKKCYRYEWLVYQGLVSRRGRTPFSIHRKTELFFNLSQEDLEKFFEENKEFIFNYMIDEMDSERREACPFSNQDARKYYEHYVALDKFQQTIEPTIIENIDSQ